MSAVNASAGNLHKRRFLQFVGDYTGPCTLVVYGIALWYYKEHENIFTFAAWGLLDFLTGLALLKTGDEDDRKSAPLPLAYGVICAFVVLMIWKNGQMKWGLIEWICLAGVVSGLILWKKLNSTAAVLAFCMALTIASIPILIDNYYTPNRWEWWLWVGSGVSATAGLILNYPWRLKNIASWLFVGVSEVVGTILLILLFR